MAKSQIDVQIDKIGWARLCAPERFVQRIITAAQEATEPPADFELSIVLATDAAVQRLNREYRGKDSPTNVLSFPGYEGAPLMPGQRPHLGDIFLAAGTVQREAKAQGKTLEQHLAHLLVHGFLHLLGYTHDDDSNARHMEEQEKTIMQKLGFSDPYMQEQ